MGWDYSPVAIYGCMLSDLSKTDQDVIMSLAEKYISDYGSKKIKAMFKGTACEGVISYHLGWDEDFSPDMVMIGRKAYKGYDPIEVLTPKSEWKEAFKNRFGKTPKLIVKTECQ